MTRSHRLRSLALSALLALSVAATASPVCAVAEEATEGTGQAAMYRLYNPNSGEHFYTVSNYEAESLVDEGWDYEGVGWMAPTTSSTPVYRLYNPNAGDHHYTTSAYERDSLVDAGWCDEGIGWYSDDARTVALLRQYNPNAVAGAHNFTTSEFERDSLVKAGWSDEGIGWYGSGTGKEDPYKGVLTRTPIMGKSTATVDQMVAYYNRTGKTYPSDVYARYGAADIRAFCTILVEEANAEGINAEVLFAQAMHETGNLQFGGQVSAEQCNFGGLGATNGGAAGADFRQVAEEHGYEESDSVRIGLRAQVQHLKAYATKGPLNNECVDPRFGLVPRGVAPYVELLAGRWAVPGDGYGKALVTIMEKVA